MFGIVWDNLFLVWCCWYTILKYVEGTLFVVEVKDHLCFRHLRGMPGAATGLP